VVLLELGTSRGDLGLPLRRYGARPLQVFPRLVQRLVPVHERRLHPLDRGDILRNLGVQLRRLVPQGLRLVHQPPVWSPQGLDEGVEGNVLPRYQLSLASKRSRVSYLSWARRFKSCCRRARREKRRVKRSANAEETKGKNHESRQKSTNPEDAPHVTSMDPQRFIQRPVERGVVVTELLPQSLLGLGTGEVSRWRVGALSLLLRTRRGAVRSREDPA
jgi:hypothetical protein